MYPSYVPLPTISKAERVKLTLRRKWAKVKRLDYPVLIGFTVLLLLMGLVVLSLAVTAHIKLEEKEDAGLEGDIATDLRTVTISLTVLGSVQTSQSIFALVCVVVNNFPLVVLYIVTGILASAGNVAVAGYSFYCREQTHDYVQDHKSCTICEVSHDVVFKYALPAMAIAIGTAVFHMITFVATYRVVKYLYRKGEVKAAEKMKEAFYRKYMRPQGHQPNGSATQPPMPPLYPSRFQYPPLAVPPLSYLNTYPQVPHNSHNPYSYGSSAPYGSYPYEDVHRGLGLPDYTLGGVNNFTLPDGTSVQDNLYQPKPKSDVYSWRSYKAPFLPGHEFGEEGRSMYMRNGEADYYNP